MHNCATRGFWLAASVLTAILTAELIARANVASSQADRTTSQTRQFTGQVLSASSASVVSRAPANPGHPVAGATIYLVPVTAIDVTTPMTASAIYAPPYPAEAYDEPLEDAIRLRGGEIPAGHDGRARQLRQSPTCPTGKFFVHVTPGPKDAEHLPGGDQSRRSYPAEELRGQSMTIKVSSSPSASARYTGSSSLPVLPQGQAALAADRAQAGMDRARSSGADAGFLEAPGLLQRARVVP